MKEESGQNIHSGEIINLQLNTLNLDGVHQKSHLTRKSSEYRYHELEETGFGPQDGEHLLEGTIDFKTMGATAEYVAQEMGRTDSGMGNRQQ